MTADSFLLLCLVITGLAFMVCTIPGLKLKRTTQYNFIVVWLVVNVISIIFLFTKLFSV